MADQTRMTTERFFGGVEGRMEYLHNTLKFVDNAEPNKEHLRNWILDNTPAETGGLSTGISTSSFPSV